MPGSTAPTRPTAPSSWRTPGTARNRHRADAQPRPRGPRERHPHAGRYEPRREPADPRLGAPVRLRRAHRTEFGRPGAHHARSRTRCPPDAARRVAIPAIATRRDLCGAPGADCRSVSSRSSRRATSRSDQWAAERRSFEHAPSASASSVSRCSPMRSCAARSRRSRRAVAFGDDVGDRLERIAAMLERQPQLVQFDGALRLALAAVAPGAARSPPPARSTRARLASCVHEQRIGAGGVALERRLQRRPAGLAAGGDAAASRAAMHRHPRAGTRSARRSAGVRGGVRASPWQPAARGGRPPRVTAASDRAKLRRSTR
jgi:hypothetical protein